LFFVHPLCAAKSDDSQKRQSSKAIISQPVVESVSLSILESGKPFFGQHLLKSVKSMHILHFPFFFLTMTMFANHVGY
jgi:hypothetical protein